MANKTKATLKTFFQTGDIPSEQNYVDFIDSKYNLEETGVQISKGTFSGSAILGTLTVKDSFANLGPSSFTLPITASSTAHISASGNTILADVSASNYMIK